MQTLKIKNLYYKYPSSSIPVFENIDLEFHKGWTAIVGSNGSGKSTLLKLIAKELKSDITIIKGNDLVYYCQQSTEKPPKYLEDFMATYSSKAFKIRDLLGIKDEWIDVWDELSHGERKRLQIAVALFNDSDILMIDEPTNHLDIQSKAIVQKALKSFKGIGILVSHDRYLLDQLSHSTMMIRNSKITTYKLKFSLSMDEYKNNILRLQKMQGLQDNKIDKLDKLMQTQKEKVSQSKKRISKKHIDPKDHGAKEKIKMARLTGKDKNDGQMLKQTKAKHQKLSDNSIIIEKQSQTGITFDMTKSKKSFPIVLESHTLNISDKQRLSFETLSIEMHDKINIVGENGSGKSSFIRYLLSKMEFKNTYLYIPQEITEEESKTLFQEVDDMPKEEKGELFTLIKRLSSDPKRLLQSEIPSPGEVRKLLIAKGLLEQPALIILDEPTNHMDIESIQALESALQEYMGTLVIISHDKVFVEAIATRTWELQKIEDSIYKLS